MTTLPLRYKLRVGRTGRRAAVVVKMLYGNCPVQGEGTVDRIPFYFRARGNTWSMSVGDEPVARPVWYHRELYKQDKEFAAGWMEEAEALSLIREAAQRYLDHAS